MGNLKNKNKTNKTNVYIIEKQINFGLDILCHIIKTWHILPKMATKNAYIIDKKNTMCCLTHY